MKVLITTDWYAPVINGVVTSVINLEKQLIERGHEVKIVTLSKNAHSYVEGNVTYLASIGIGCIYPEARLKVLTRSKLIRDLIEWKPDIIHSQCEFSTFFLAKKIKNALQIPMVHTYHTIYEDYTHYFSPRKKWGKEVVEFLTRRLSYQVDALIAPSEKISHLLKGYEVVCPVEVIPSGIERKKYELEKQKEWKTKIRQQFHISDDQTVLLYVGRLAKEKNIEEILAYQKQMQQYGTILLIVGDGPYREALENRTKELELEESVIFTGMIAPEEVGNYYQAGDLFVSASNSETQGLTYAEALASGMPLLCRRDACLKNVVMDGINGWQYESEEEFQENLLQWQAKKEEEKQALCEEARRSSKMFSSEVFAERIEQLYIQVLKERKPFVSFSYL